MSDMSIAVAAWVQAIGSIAAIFAAGRIASRQSREAAARATEQDKDQAKREGKMAYVLANRLASILVDIETHLEPAAKAVSKLESMAGPLREDREAVISGLSLRVPQNEMIFDCFYLLPAEAARVTAHLFYAVARYDRESSLLLRFVADHGGDLATAKQKLGDNLQSIQTDLGKATSLLAPILGKS